MADFARPLRRALPPLLALVFLSCARAPTEPEPPPTDRAVTATLTDSLGTPVPNALLLWQSATSTSAHIEISFTDPNGNVATTLKAGDWTICSEVSGKVAASTFAVREARTAADTGLVRLVLHTPSTLSGVVLLAGASDHRGTTASHPILMQAETDSTGTWSNDRLPPGTWPIHFLHPGFQATSAQVFVPAPGSTVRADTVTLVPL